MRAAGAHRACDRGALDAQEHLAGLPTKTAQAAAGLAAAEGRALYSAASETMLLHGTSRDVLLSVLSNGLNERFSGSHAGTAFGDGVYLAEDVGKTDQYTAVDARYDRTNELHLRLYGRHHAHPENVFYLLVCRVCLGYAARTTQTGKGAEHVKTDQPLFPISFRELACIPSVTPPILPSARGGGRVVLRCPSLSSSSCNTVSTLVLTHWMKKAPLRAARCPGPAASGVE